MEDLRRMAIFAAVVEEQGFTAAARKLGLTKSAVSKNITQLESRYGVQLLHRTTRRIRPTDAGATFYDSCAHLVRTAEAAVTALGDQSGEPRGFLRVAAPVGMGEQLIAPVMADFLAAHPHLSGELVLGESMVDMLAERIDVAVRAGRLTDSTLIARKLAPLGLVACASPAYLARRKPPRRLSQIDEHDWIAFSPLGMPQKVVFRRKGRQRTVRINARVITNNGSVLREFIRRGLGIGLLPEFFIADDLKRGAVSRALPSYEIPMGAIYAVYPQMQFVPAKVRRFVAALVEALAAPRAG